MYNNPPKPYSSYPNPLLFSPLTCMYNIHTLVISTIFSLTQRFEFTVSVNFFCLLNREALDKAEKATERLAAVSKDVIKALELANPKETKK